MVSHRDGVCTAGPESGSMCCERFPEYDIGMLTSKKDQDAGGGSSYRSREYRNRSTYCGITEAVTTRSAHYEVK